MSKTCQKLDLKNSWNWRTVLITATVWQLFIVKLIRGKRKYMSIWWNLLGKTREITLMELILWQLLAIGTTVLGTRLLLLHFFQHKWILSGQPTDMPKKPTLSRFGDFFPLSYIHYPCVEDKHCRYFHNCDKENLICTKSVFSSGQSLDGGNDIQICQCHFSTI